MKDFEVERDCIQCYIRFDEEDLEAYDALNIDFKNDHSCMNNYIDEIRNNLFKIDGVFEVETYDFPENISLDIDFANYERTIRLVKEKLNEMLGYSNSVEDGDMESVSSIKCDIDFGDDDLGAYEKAKKEYKGDFELYLRNSLEDINGLIEAQILTEYTDNGGAYEYINILLSMEEEMQDEVMKSVADILRDKVGVEIGHLLEEEEEYDGY